MSTYDGPAGISKSPEFSLDRILHWSARRGLQLYSGSPGDKYPVKDRHTDGTFSFRRWTGQAGPVLLRCHRQMACLDGDDEAGIEYIASLNLPPHFAIKSRKTGGEKHFGAVPDGVRRAIRPLCDEIGFDLIGNPDDLSIWLKIWDDCGYDVISDSDATPDLTWVVGEIQRRQGILAAQQAIEGKPVTMTAGGPVPVDRYLEEGIPYGKQGVELWRAACSMAARGHEPDEIRWALAAIIEESEVNHCRPWPGQLFSDMADRAWKKFGRPRAQLRQLEMAEPESEPPATPGIVAPTKEGGSSPDATTGFPVRSRRACEDLIRDPALVRELLRNSWDETGKVLGKGNDWHGSPSRCHEAYDHHLLTWADGADIRVADMEPAHVRWLENPGLFIGPWEDPEYVQFIRLDGDLVVPQDMALKGPGPEYPGWDDETQRPSEGRRCGWRTRAAVLEAVGSGKATDRPAICALLNDTAWREAHPELDLRGCKGFKRKAIDKCVERLIHDGELYVAEEAIQYWRNRTWNTVPAVLAIPEVPEEPPAASELDGEDEPTGNNRIVAVWARRQMKQFSRAARKKRGRQQEHGTPQGEGTAGQRRRAENTTLCNVHEGDVTGGRHHREMGCWPCPGSQSPWHLAASRPGKGGPK
jgi:hypothetical protein